MLAKFAISISFAPCENIANIYITMNRIKMREKIAKG